MDVWPGNEGDDHKEAASPLWGIALVAFLLIVPMLGYVIGWLVWGVG